MDYEFRLPDLGEGIAEAEVRRWLVAEGDIVEEHQAVLEVETDKAVVEVPSPKAGMVIRLNKAEGEMAQVGEVLLVVSSEVKETQKPPSYGIVGVLPEADSEASSPAPATVSEEEETVLLATPGVRALAAEKGVDLALIEGSGPEGSITSKDVLAACDAGLFARRLSGEDDEERIPLRGVRRAIAERLMQSQMSTAFVTTMEEADVTELWVLKKREESELANQGIHLTFFPFFIKAVQHALKEFPRLNASLDNEAKEIVLKKKCHIGVAVDTSQGLMVPVIRNVAQKSIVELAEELQQLSQRAMERQLTLEELKGSTFTITNFGSFGGGFATPIINPPNVAILGCGKIAERPWVVEGQICIRRIISLSLTFDHQVTDGADATRFLSKVGRYLADPGLLFVESI